MTNYNAPLGDTALPVRAGPHPAFSGASILAIVCALLALFNVLGGAIGFILAILAVVLGAVGMLSAILPGTRGGIISFLAVGAGLLAIVIALFRLLGHVVSSV